MDEWRLFALSRLNGTKQYQHRQLQTAFWKTCARMVAASPRPSARHAGSIGNGFAIQFALRRRWKYETQNYSAAYDALFRKAQSTGNPQAVDELKSIGPPPYPSGQGYQVQRKWANRF